jgi:hypothetical protein
MIRCCCTPDGIASRTEAAGNKREIKSFLKTLYGTCLQHEKRRDERLEGG